MKRGPSNGPSMLIGVDKPVGPTSHDVVARLRRALGERRIGHSGTLDPLASGVMVVGVGQATRLLALATADEKRYTARFVFGRETVTDDSEGETRREAPAPAEVLDPEWARVQMGILLAMTEQVPPAYSAIQVDGVRSYKAARDGAELELATRPVCVREASLVATGSDEATGEPWWDVDVLVSKGTYVRALCRDLGRALGSACHVGALRRTASGSVGVAECRPLADVVADGQAFPLDPVRVIGCARVALGEKDLEDVRCGRRLSVARTDGGAASGLPEGATVALVREGRLYATAARCGGALAPHVVLPDGVVGVAQ